ncbi:MAG: DNRLRE domain-containing protein [Agriterribacter sp.]
MKISTNLISLIVLFASIFFVSCLKEKKALVKQTLILKPGPNDGRDVNVGYYDGDGGSYSNNNNIHNPDLSATRWTFGAQGGGQGTFRAYIKFAALYGLPEDVIIESAKLSLYGVSKGTAAPQGNSSYPGSPYVTSNENNKCWLKRVTENWNERTITWNNKPATTDINQVEVPASTSQFNNDALDIDVTKLVQDMFADGKKTAGFCLQLQSEDIYRTLNFASSRYSDSTKRPKLVVEYKLNANQ